MIYCVLVDFDNAAFGDNPGVEVGRILSDLGTECRNTGVMRNMTLRDINGNRVGYCAPTTIAGLVNSVGMLADETMSLAAHTRTGRLVSLTA